MHISAPQITAALKHSDLTSSFLAIASVLSDLHSDYTDKLCLCLKVFIFQPQSPNALCLFASGWFVVSTDSISKEVGRGPSKNHLGRDC